MKQLVRKNLEKPQEARIRAENKARILKAAVHLFATKGFDGTRLSEIAEFCGLPRPNLYYYFSSKEGIYTALIEQVIKGWDQAFEHIRSDREPREAIEAYIHTKLEYSRTHPVESRFFASEILRGAKFLTQRHRGHIKEVTDLRANVVKQWVDEGKISPVDPYHFFIILWSATQFYADYGSLAAGIIRKQKLLRKDFTTAAKTISGIVLDGCCKVNTSAPKQEKIKD
ncbi:MAG: TetR/AcrR family transcriptional regulator [Rhodobacteraceae bacterium]|nr:TetR/AcrR family transcriptional regulator [Paracoccaceae bacterium]